MNKEQPGALLKVLRKRERLSRKGLTVRIQSGGFIRTGLRRNIFLTAVIIALTCILASCSGVASGQTTDENKTESSQTLASESEDGQSFSVMETESHEFTDTPSGLSLIGLKPCVLAGGAACLYEDGYWNVISEESFSEIYSGEYFCGVTEEGKIVADLVPQEEYESYPLTSAGAFYNAEEVVKQTAGKAVAQLGAGIFNESVLVLYEDGETELFANGTSYPVAEELTVVEVSGNYLRTDTGEVYLVKAVFHETSSTMSVTLKQVSSDQIVSICAYPAADRCAGIRSDGTVEMWSEIEQEMAGEFQGIEKICMGFGYCIAVGNDGKAHFSAYDTDMAEEIEAYLCQQSGTAALVACEAQRIAVLHEGGNIVLIDF